MLNLQSKFGQKLLTISNWIAALVTINLVWFLINLPVLVMLILAISLPLNQLFAMTMVIVTVMLATFTVPATTAAYQTVRTWQMTDSGSFLRATGMAYLKALMHWQPNALIAVLASGWLILLRVTTANIMWHVATLVVGLVLLTLWNGWNYSQFTTTSMVELVVAHPVKLILSAVTTIILFAINFELRLIFCILLFSMSLSALATYRIFNPRVKVTEDKQVTN
ncbi:hypothetical protein [Lactiplantibacillus mudanjiangensis]|uniref:Uncharacterized protein n=1 Tax=Lactiplantibacillus mudanjiangensis TaxID=1296538 RepID=A0A660DUI0_9LACO|nr:hypothetical protein [Lactiplantibacillus mudanjiangensis]VDG21202.1 hypothetical protein [Lactobacillus sp. CBA3605] [Lactiplantibacillus mudanjiangensis]VDG22858.1 hypothetical protein [Lactobacillus sp. CBA3605] [Lactiplantibacillus mudanjiangensis]VDG26567.1 hypothetical protein [Lactobacillus sp. CBA3605] [Lactiplantibacillus mudanjiangensis]VDG31805.1 hypothetical protein [Lactobacillus sp. CBA3605] [Lactiplantibacillus mudanjiangensis]